MALCIASPMYILPSTVIHSLPMATNLHKFDSFTSSTSSGLWLGQALSSFVLHASSASIVPCQAGKAGDEIGIRRAGQVLVEFAVGIQRRGRLGCWLSGGQSPLPPLPRPASRISAAAYPPDWAPIAHVGTIAPPPPGLPPPGPDAESPPIPLKNTFVPSIGSMEAAISWLWRQQ